MIINRHVIPIGDPLHAPHGVRNDTASELRSIMGSPLPSHKVLHLPSITSLPKNVLYPVTFFGIKIPMLSAPFVDGYPQLSYAENICHLHSLFAPIQTIINAIVVKWSAHLTIFLTITVARIHFTNAFRFQKMAT